jgi:hypothetical protein
MRKLLTLARSTFTILLSKQSKKLGCVAILPTHRLENLIKLDQIPEEVLKRKDR